MTVLRLTAIAFCILLSAGCAKPGATDLSSQSPSPGKPSALADTRGAPKAVPPAGKSAAAPAQDGWTLLLMKEWDKALGAFQDTLRKTPGDVAALEGAGLACLRLGREDEADDYFRKGFDVDPGLARLHVLRGIVQDRKLRTEEAAEEYRQALLRDPLNAEAHNNLGVIRLRLGQPDQAETSFREALRLSPAPETYNNLGLALCEQERFNEALEAFRKGGDAAAAFNNLGACHLRQRNNDKAMELFEKAMAASPRYYARAAENLAKTKEKSRQAVER